MPLTERPQLLEPWRLLRQPATVPVPCLFQQWLHDSLELPLPETLSKLELQLHVTQHVPAVTECTLKVQVLAWLLRVLCWPLTASDT